MEIGIDVLVGSVGDSYDNVLVENVIGFFKIEVINLFGFWKLVS